MSKLENKALAMNTLHSWLNDVMPKLVEELKNGYTLKQSGELFKKDKERFNALLDTKPKNARAYLSFSSNSVWLKADIHYMVSDVSCNYYKREMFLLNVNNHDEVYPYELKTDYTKEFFMEAEKAIKEYENQKRIIEDKISSLRLIIAE